MNKLPKDKRDKMIQIGGAALVLLALIWFFVISAQRTRLSNVGQGTESVTDKIGKAEIRIKGAKFRAADMEPLSQELGALERHMAPANRREWIISMVSDFSKPYKVEYQRFASETALDSEPLPKFPYKLVSLSVTFRSNYHDFGKFIAAFENRHPFISVMNLRIKTEADVSDEDRRASGSDREKLQFTVDFVALSKPATAL